MRFTNTDREPWLVCRVGEAIVFMEDMGDVDMVPLEIDAETALVLAATIKAKAEAILAARR